MTIAQILTSIAANLADASSITASELRSELENIANELRDYRGALDCSADPNYPAAEVGDCYRVSVRGKVGGSSGPVVQAGALLICHTAASAGTHSSVGSSWIIYNNRERLSSNVAGLFLQQSGGAYIERDGGEDDELVYHTGANQVIVSRELDTTNESDSFSIAIPSGCKFYPSSIRIICSDYSAPTNPGEVNIGDNASASTYASAQSISALTAEGKAIGLTLTDFDGVTSLVGSINSATSSGTLAVRVIFEGVIIRDQP